MNEALNLINNKVSSRNKNGASFFKEMARFVHKAMENWWGEEI